ncbi:MAG TPA: sigma-70 family RNA polymerase sigma factor [Syntrophomonadaceae bacterium]|nr:sigma-70 family RNA polymerase sigma factor [Syntrophomonadaceae bacterium]
MQEAFAKAICAFHKLKDPNKFKPWLTRIALNTGKSWVERNSHVSYLAEIEVAASSFDLPLEEAINAETRKVVIDAISYLSPQEQKVVVLRFYLDLLEKDIANILGISEGTVKSVLHRSKQKLGRHLSMWYEKERDGRGRR